MGGSLRRWHGVAGRRTIDGGMPGRREEVRPTTTVGLHGTRRHPDGVGTGAASELLRERSVQAMDGRSGRLTAWEADAAMAGRLVWS